MGLLTGIVATGAAFVNYRNAKRDYEALVEKRDGLLSAVQMFNSGKDEVYIEQLQKEYAAQEISFPDDVKVTAILRTSYLVGSMFRCVASVVLTNLSDKSYEIGTVAADCFVLGTPILVKDFDRAISYMSAKEAKDVPQSIGANLTLQSGQTAEIPFKGGVSAVPDMGALRQFVCDACGKRLITSCPIVSIEDVIKADILYKWREVGEKEWHTAKYTQKNGIFRYCMELPLYANS